MMNEPRVSVITVAFNAVNDIRTTLESFFSQTWENKELIVIDGGSTDGTVDVIKEYADRIGFWCSEPDRGIYDAMNKGIAKASGDWINFLNCGDYYVSPTSIEDVMKSKAAEGADVIYGNSIEVDNVKNKDMVAGDDPKMIAYFPIYRHGSSFVKATVQKSHLFDLSKSSKLHYSLDEEMIFRLFKGGAIFKKADVFIEAYKKEGTSNHPYKNLWYNYLITSEGKFHLAKFALLLKLWLIEFIKGSTAYTILKAFIMGYCVNDVLPHIPFWSWRKCYLRLLGMGIGKGSFVMKRTYMFNPNRIKIGQYSHINRACFLDGRGGIMIGNSVSVSHNVSIVTGSHDIHSPQFLGIFKPITIDDYAFIGIGATILQNVHIGKGAVVCAGAVVNKDVEPYEIVGGVPARHIGIRARGFQYRCSGYQPFA